MPDRRRTPTVARPDPLVASAQVLTAAQHGDRTLFQNESWQEEAWQFWDALGEFNFGITWLSQALSRVRLMAAEQVPGGDEPVPLLDGPAADLMEQLGGGIGGRAALMKSLGVQLGVPGEGWLVAERPSASVPLEMADWRVRSTDEIQPARSRDADYEVRVGDNQWRLLPFESLVCRIFEPHKRWSWKADSSARSAIPIMREIDLYNRRIIATMVSRLAMNGLLLIPQEGTFTVPEQFRDAPDPFVAMLIEIASNNIKNPGSASAAIPMPIRFASDYIEKWKHLTFGDGVDDDLLDARSKAIGRLATTLNMPAEVLLGVADVNHWCVDSSTEILTEDGWVTHERLNPGDVVLTLNHATGLSEWQPVTDVNRWDVTDLEMQQMEGRNHSSLTTLNHRWPILDHAGRRAFRQTSELRATHKLITGAPCVDQPVEPKWSDDFVEVIAWFWTEGSVRKGDGGAVIAQSHTVNPAHVARIRSCLTRTFGPSAIGSMFRLPYDSEGTLRRQCDVADCGREHYGRGLCRRHWKRWRRRASQTEVSSYTPVRGGDRVAGWREYQTTGQSGRAITRFDLNKTAARMLLEVAPNKVVSLRFIRELTPAQLELFIHVSMLGDGQHRAGRDITQRVAARLDAIELAGILAGRMVTRSRYVEGTGFRAGRPAEQFRLYLHPRSQIGPIKAAEQMARNGLAGGMQISTERYTGTIWCPTTPNRTWLARRNGKAFYTGNSAWQLEESGIKLHISPVAETIVGGLTAGYLHPMLQAAGLDLIGPRGGLIVCWYDTSELTARPDKSAQAVVAYDRIEISGTALRRESGFDEGDKPTTAETREQLLRKLAGMPATALQAMAQLLGEPIPQAPAVGATQPSGPVGSDESESPSGVAPAPTTGPPSTRDDPPPPPGPDTPTTAAVLPRAALLPDVARVPALAGHTSGGPHPSGRVNGGRHSRDGPKKRA